MRRSDSTMRLTYDRSADAAYLYLTDARLSAGRTTTEHPGPDDADGSTVLIDWKDGRIVGIEFLAASRFLDGDLLRSAESPEPGGV